jgi:hypothetical protein
LYPAQNLFQITKKTRLHLIYFIIAALAAAGCSNHSDPVDICITNPQPGCPNYDVDPVLPDTLTLGSATYEVETTMEKFEDGFWYLKVQVKTGRKLIIHAVRYNTHVAGYSIEAWSGQDSLSGLERPSAMVSRYAAAGREVKTAINGGFYYMDAPIKVPTSAEIVRGMVNGFGRNWSPLVGFNGDNRPYIDYLTYSSMVKNKTGGELTLTNVNTTRLNNELVLYNSAIGKRTGTNTEGTEVLCTPKSGQWETLDSYINVPCRIDVVESGVGNMAVPKGKIVLSGHGTASAYLANLQTGDDITVTVNYTLRDVPNVNSSVIRNAVSGSTIILKNNVVLPPTTNEGDPTVPDPRSAVGYSVAKHYVFFTVVDGRRPQSSLGVSTEELAQVMQYLGATDAIHLDGGGSSCLMVGTSTKNTPTDGSQRAVCNGLAIIKN